MRVPVVANGEIWTLADYRACVVESGCADVMLGRGAVADPLLATRIRAGDEAPPSAADWLLLWPLLEAFWLAVLAKVEARHAPGRLKQWLNLLRRHYPQAEALYQTVRPQRLASEVSNSLITARPR